MSTIADRYTTSAMKKIFSDRSLRERELWIAVMKAQQSAGLEIPDSVIAAYEAKKEEVNEERIREIEMRTRHDVKAKIEHYNELVGYEAIHKGLTSRDLNDNVEQTQYYEASKLVFGKYIAVLKGFLDKASEYRDIVICGRTHEQPAQATTLGRRFAMWAEELHYHLLQFEKLIESYPLRGIKGPVGTQLDQQTLTGKAEQIDKDVAEHLGFQNVLDAPGQVYPRSLDYAIVSRLYELSTAIVNFATTMRLMQAHGLVNEGFKKGQSGSSAMPHKKNPRTSERLIAFSRLLKGYVSTAADLVGQWSEADVSCSAVRRELMPNAFYVSDAIVENVLTILKEMDVYPIKIRREVEQYMPFLATTQFLSIAQQKGMGREEAHQVIKELALLESEKINKGQEADLIGSIAARFNMERKQLEDCMEGLTGRAETQVDAVISKAQPLLSKYSDKANYKPGEIL